MQSRLPLRRWLTFGVAATVLVAGLVLLSAEAAGTSLAPIPDADDSVVNASGKPGVGSDGSPVVDRLHTWAETGKTKISKPTGGGKGG